MPVRLTETAINRATREVAERTRRDLTDAACPGLRLRLTPAGAAGCVLACRDRLGRIRRFPLGTFPDMGISEEWGRRLFAANEAQRERLGGVTALSGEKLTTDMPTITNIRQDPFERTSNLRGETLNNMGGGYMNDFMAREFWRFVLVQQAVGKLALTAIDYPPMQAPATFNLEAVKAKIDEMMRAHEGQ